MTAPAADPSPGRGIPIANADQAATWDGDEGDLWVAHQQRYEAMTGAFTERLLRAAEIGSGDRILDVGCGTGRPPGSLPVRRVRGSRSASTCRRRCWSVPGGTRRTTG